MRQVIELLEAEVRRWKDELRCAQHHMSKATDARRRRAWSRECAATQELLEDARARLDEYIFGEPQHAQTLASVW